MLIAINSCLCAERHALHIPLYDWELSFFFCYDRVFAAKYDVAISTACAGLDYIVVETTNAAQSCVELLRRENLGIATFMILVSLPSQSVMQNPNS